MLLFNTKLLFIYWCKTKLLSLYLWACDDIFLHSVKCSLPPSIFLGQMRQIDPKVVTALTHRPWSLSRFGDGSPRYSSPWKHHWLTLMDIVLDWAHHHVLWKLCGISAFLVQKNFVSQWVCLTEIQSLVISRSPKSKYSCFCFLFPGTMCNTGAKGAWRLLPGLSTMAWRSNTTRSFWKSATSQTALWRTVTRTTDKKNQTPNFSGAVLLECTRVLGILCRLLTESYKYAIWLNLNCTVNFTSGLNCVPWGHSKRTLKLCRVTHHTPFWWQQYLPVDQQQQLRRFDICNETTGQITWQRFIKIVRVFFTLDIHSKNTFSVVYMSFYYGRHVRTLRPINHAATLF